MTEPQKDPAEIANRRSQKVRGLRLFNTSAVAAVIVLAVLCIKSKAADPFHLYLAAIIFALAILPGLLWAKRADRGLPLFEAFMLTGLNTYSMPILNGHQALKLYDSDVITTAAIAVILFQAGAIATYYSLKFRPGRRPYWRREIVSKDISRYLGNGMFISTGYTLVEHFTTWVPDDVTSVARAACYGIGVIATFVQCRRWGEGDLPSNEKHLFVIQIVAQIVVLWTTLYLVQGISILVLALLGYVSSARKVPVMAIVLILPIVGILHNGKSPMRDKYWTSNHPAPTVAEIPSFYAEWFSDGLSLSKSEGETEANVLDRTSLIHLMCLIVSMTPDRLPYLMGLTYEQIPAQFVPRFFWPQKPVAHISTYTLAIYYGLQREEDTEKTTIGFGMVTEAYANYGMFGVTVLGLVMGAFFKKVVGLSSESPILSYPGLFTVVLMAWTFQTELTLSIWLSSLFQACVTVLGMPFILKSLFR